VKLPVLLLATLLAVTGCTADPDEVSSRERRDRTGHDARPATDRDGPRRPATDEPSAGPETPGTETPGRETSGATFAGAVYYLGDTDRGGVRLYREFRPATGERLGGTLDLLMAQPLDPDYRTFWRPGTLQSAAVVGDRIQVVMAETLTGRPGGMSADHARQAVQQVVYSLQAAVQQRLPVEFTTQAGPVEEVLGLPTPGPVRQGSPLQVLSHVSLTSPEQGSTVGDTLRVTGVGNSFEANVGWEIRQGGRVVDDGFATAEGWMGDRLFPFETTIDVSGLAPGSYTFRVITDDPTGGTEGVGAMTDDKDFTIR
jgi:hypothetical protein